MNLGDCIYNVTKYDENGVDIYYEEMEDVLSCIPPDKRINVLGNHDVMKLGSPSWVEDKGITNMYFSNKRARYFNGTTGDFVIYDDKYNIKYVCVNGWEFKDTRIYANSTKQMKGIIRELEKNDGYDIVILSHVPLGYEKAVSNAILPTSKVNNLDAWTWSVWEKNGNTGIDLWEKLYKKEKGTVLDSDGVEHPFDFTHLDCNILCGLHGHTHNEGWYHVRKNGMLDVLFKNMYINQDSDGNLDGLTNYIPKTSSAFSTNSNTATFALIDKINERVEVWSVSGASRGSGELYGLNHWYAPFSFEQTTNITLSFNNKNANVGDEITINATTEGSSEPISWRSSDEQIATVLGDHLDGNIGNEARIYCLKRGTVVIKAITETGAVFDTCSLVIS